MNNNTLNTGSMDVMSIESSISDDSYSSDDTTNTNISDDMEDIKDIKDIKDIEEKTTIVVNKVKNKYNIQEEMHENTQIKEEYDISRYGFNSEIKEIKITSEINRMIQLFYENFTDIIKYRETIDKYDNENSRTYEEYKIILKPYDDNTIKYLYSTFCYFVCKYVWGEPDKKEYDINLTKHIVYNIRQIIPLCIGGIFDICARRLGLPSIITHSAVNLYNFKLDEDGEILLKTYLSTDILNINNILKIDEIMDGLLEHIQIKNTFTDDESEKWFYKIHICIELAAIKMLNEIIKLFDTDREITKHGVIKVLRTIEHTLNIFTNIISKMESKCNSEFFWNNIRYYLNGFNTYNVKIKNTGIILTFKGGSAAQSTLLPIIDALLNYEHTDKYVVEFLKEQQNYMPIKHRLFIEWIDNKIKCKKWKNYFNNFHHFNKCYISLRMFRQKHHKIVHKYISANIHKEIEKEGNINRPIQDKGTGGSDYDKLLKTIIDNCIMFNPTNTQSNITIYKTCTIVSSILVVSYIVYKFLFDD